MSKTVLAKEQVMQFFKHTREGHLLHLKLDHTPISSNVLEKCLREGVKKIWNFPFIIQPNPLF